jgi:hypothetical protein
MISRMMPLGKYANVFDNMFLYVTETCSNPFNFWIDRLHQSQQQSRHVRSFVYDLPVNE